MKKFTANRIVLILHGVVVTLTAVGIFLAAVNGSLPKKWQESVAAAIGIVGALTAGTVAVVKYLDGSQKWDALTVHAAETHAPRRPTAVKHPAAKHE